MCYYCKQTIRADICAQGYCGLGSTVKTLGLGSDEPVEVDYIVGYTRTQNRVHVGPDKGPLQCSSIGAVKDDLMAALYNACKGLCATPGSCRPRWLLTRPTGDSGMMEYEARTGKQKKNKDAPLGAHQAGFKGHTRVYFPSRETVRTSRGGTNVSYRNAPQRIPQPWYPTPRLQSEWCFLITV